MSQQEENIRGLEEQCSLLQRKVNGLKTERIKAIDSAAKFKLDEDLAEAERQLEEAKASLAEAKAQLKDIKEAGTDEAPTLLHHWHRLTCDRIPQNNRFQGVLRDQADQWVQFFYLYGLDRHAHEALVERFAFDLEGVLQSHLNPAVTARCRVELADPISLDLNPDFEAYKIELLNRLFAAFSLDANDCGPLLQRNLAYLWQHSQRLKQLGPEDRVCCYLVIPEFDWDADITPQLVTWLIDEFCGSGLPPEAPSFYFFLGIEFEDEDSEVKGEVEAAIRAGGKRVQTLPELQVVERRDLKRWFSTYRKYIPDRQQREALQQQHFGEASIHYMEDVVTALERIIDEINHPK